MLYLLAFTLLAQVDDILSDLDKPADPPAATAGEVTDPAAPAEATSSDPNATATDGNDAPAEPAADDMATEGEEDETEAVLDGGPETGVLAKLDEIFSSGAIGLLREGGFFMWVLLMMAILGTGVIIERFRTLKMLSTDSGLIREEVRMLLEHDRIEEALEVCDREQGPVPAVLYTGLRKYLLLRTLKYDPGKTEEQVVKSMEDYSVHIVAALEKHLPILATISSAAPTLGFLGTVQGMIIAFRDIVAQMGEKNIVESAAEGIQVSLLTTCFGLIIGIPAFVAFNYFTSVINRFVLDVEESSTELIESVTLQLAVAESEKAEDAVTVES